MLNVLQRQHLVGHVCENVSGLPGLLSTKNIRKFEIDFSTYIPIIVVLVRSNELRVVQRFSLKNQVAKTAEKSLEIFEACC